MDAPRKRPYGHGSVSLQRGSYVATFKSLETGLPSRRSFDTDAEAQAYLDAWHAEAATATFPVAAQAKAKPQRELTPQERRREATRERRREADRIRHASPEVRAYKRTYMASYRADANAERKAKLAARSAVSNAVHRGELVPGPCVKAGPYCRGRIQAHHDSYEPDHWLDVRWTCTGHHAELDRERRKRRRASARPRKPAAPIRTRRALGPLDTPRKRPYGHGSVSIQHNTYVATFKSVETSRPSRRSFATDTEAQAYLDAWHAEASAAKLAGAVRHEEGQAPTRADLRGAAPTGRTGTASGSRAHPNGHP
jgi:hypothetical protein